MKERKRKNNHGPSNLTKKESRRLAASIFDNDSKPSSMSSSEIFNERISAAEKKGCSSLFDPSKSNAFLKKSISRKNHNLVKMRKDCDPLEARKRRTNSEAHKALVSKLTVPVNQIELASDIMKQYGVVILTNESSSVEKSSVIPQNVSKLLRDYSDNIEQEICARLDLKKINWRTLKEKNSSQMSELTNESNSFRYKEVASRCLGRLDVRWRTNLFPFNAPEVVENTFITKLMEKLLGKDAKLLYCGLIYSMPNSADQPWHQDGTPLFDESELKVDVPPYAMNVFIPLDNIDEAIGPTEFILESHKNEHAQRINLNVDKAIQWDYQPIGPLLFSGEVLIYDYRVCHRGAKNLSTQTRTMLYLMYARPWFKEHLNFSEDCLFEN